MARNQVVNVGVLALAVVGALVVLPFLFSLFGNLFGLLISVAIWMVAGALAGRLMRGSSYSLLMNIGLGLIGGIVGSLAFSVFGLGFVGGIPLLGPIAVGTVGAILVIGLVRLFGNSSFAR